jgi:N-sulfoglucosamine sulfohydrolase
MGSKSFSRRSFLKRSLSAAATGSLMGGVSLSGCTGHGPADADNPNILFITADNLGWRDLSCYGNRNTPTPNLDRLAEQGALFENAFCVSSSCAPSRASFITGQYPHTHGVTGLPHIQFTGALSPFKMTLPKILKYNGYKTAIEGKWHVSPYLPTSWYGYNERLSGVFAEDHFIRNTEKTIQYLEENKDNRFFFQVNYKNSHRDRYGEYHFHPDFPVDPESIEVPRYMAMPNWPEIREDLAKYYSQNLQMEHMIGQVLKSLDDLSLTDKTLVMFVSDNGPHYPGMISTLYDRGLATPLIVRWPGKVQPGRRINHLVSTVDIMPTFLEAAGVPVPESVQGRSFMSLLEDENAAPIREEVYMEQTEHVRYIPCRAVRNLRWKYIKNYSDNAFGLDQNNHDRWAHRMCELLNHPWKRPRVEEELYDIVADPNEQNNLASNERYTSELSVMRNKLEAHMKETEDPYLGRPFTRDFNIENYREVPEGYKYW